MKSRGYLLSVVLVTSILLAACGGSEPATPFATLPPVTVAPPQSIQYVPGCTVTDLENWLEITYYLVGDYVSLTNQADNRSREEIQAEMPHITSLRNTLLAVPVPEACAAEAQQIIIAMLDDTLTAYQNYANGELDTLEAFVSSLDVSLGEIQSAQIALGNQLRTAR